MKGTAPGLCRHIAVFVNPHAGKGRPDRLLPVLSEFLQEQRI
jgi:diacylglycerol kinase family enzyme